MPKLRQTAVEKMLSNAKGEIGKAMIKRDWSKSHLAAILPWGVSAKYKKLCLFFKNPGAINLNDFAIMLDKLGLKIEVKEKGGE